MRFGKLNVLAGLRYDTVKSSADSMLNGARTTGLDGTDNAFSGSLGAIYEVSPLLRPYANYARAFRAPACASVTNPASAATVISTPAAPRWKPRRPTSSSWASRVPAASSSPGGRLSQPHRELPDRPDPDRRRRHGGLRRGQCQQLQEDQNLGSVTINGFEANARWQVVSGHWLSAGYSLVRGTNNDLDEPLFQMPADEARLGWLGNVLPGVKADFTLRLVDRQDRIATRFTRGTENATAGFVTADLGATWAFAKNQSLRLAVRNLADKTYHEHQTEGLSGWEIKAPAAASSSPGAAVSKRKESNA
jgi:hemoglobin/transferrin/lactoferrin receptor protein